MIKLKSVKRKMLNHVLVYFGWIICSSFADYDTSVLSNIDNQTAFVGENVIFLCRTDLSWANSSDRLEWSGPFNTNTYEEKKVNKYCTNDGITNEGICVLDLLNVTKSDQGRYMCSMSISMDSVITDYSDIDVRSAWLTVHSENDFVPPENVSASLTSNGVLVTWDQPNTTLEVTSYRVYYRSKSEDNHDIWKYSDTSGTSSNILLLIVWMQENYALKVQAIYNIYHSRNVSRTVLQTFIGGKTNTENYQNKAYMYAVIVVFSLTCFGFALRRCSVIEKGNSDGLSSQLYANGNPDVNQRDRNSSNTAEPMERESVLYEEIDDNINCYESITSCSLEGQLYFVSNKTASEPVQDELYSYEELGSITARKVLYAEENGSTNYIHPVYSQMDGNTRLSQYVYGRIPDNFSSKDSGHQVNAAVDSEYVYGRIPDTFGSTDNILQENVAVDTEYVYERIPDTFGSTDNIHQENVAIDTEYDYGRIPDESGNTNFTHPETVEIGMKYVYGLIPGVSGNAYQTHPETAERHSKIVKGRIPDESFSTDDAHLETTEVDTENVWWTYTSCVWH